MMKTSARCRKSNPTQHVPDCTNESSAVYSNHVLPTDCKTPCKSSAEPGKQGVISLDNAGHGKQDTSTDNADDGHEDVASGPDKINAEYRHHSGLVTNSDPPPRIMATKI